MLSNPRLISYMTPYWTHRSTLRKKKTALFTVTVIISLLFFLAFVTWSTATLLSSASPLKSFFLAKKEPKFTLKCNEGNRSSPSCLITHNTSVDLDCLSNTTCPSYFRWIHEDLRPWRKIGITSDMINKARKTAHFRLVIINGKAYIDKYKKSIQTRDMFTLWGILQLLKVYPGKLPDLELMFDCDDRPVVRSRDFQVPNARPPPLFRYCGDESTLDIVFPDWSFWGWAETNIRPWESVLKNIKEGNKKTQWRDRVPYAYWRGNPHVASTRKDLLTCNVSRQNDWNARLYVQDWVQESKSGFKESNLGDQCTHRYKIYIEGWAWSVSEKYILACDSMTMYVRPNFYDFYIRGMMPLQHYWPINDTTKCTSLKFAVDWANNHTQEAKCIGEAGSGFIEKEMNMKYVYDYMFHVLNEYGKLMKFKPTIGSTTMEVSSESMLSSVNGRLKELMEESRVIFPSHSLPCTFPPPYHDHTLHQILEAKASSIRQVKIWETEYWQNFNHKH